MCGFLEEARSAHRKKTFDSNSFYCIAFCFSLELRGAFYDPNFKQLPFNLFPFNGKALEKRLLSLTLYHEMFANYGFFARIINSESWSIGKRRRSTHSAENVNSLSAWKNITIPRPCGEGAEPKPPTRQSTDCGCKDKVFNFSHRSALHNSFFILMNF